MQVSKVKEATSVVIDLSERLGFSPAEFAAMFGRQKVWGYRKLYEGRVKAIRDSGRIIIPKSEIERFVSEMTTYGSERHQSDGIRRQSVAR